MNGKLRPSGLKSLSGINISGFFYHCCEFFFFNATGFTCDNWDRAGCEQDRITHTFSQLSSENSLRE